MKKKVIVLADNSYTIRRIVELSFSEIENIEVHSFENGSGLKEKLLQLQPDMVIIDIKLPEISGYDICRFINETPTLNRSRVFLMKGSFEAVDNEMIKNLKYEDIVTKPFDSNALVNSVMKVLNQEEQKGGGKIAHGEPSSFPEDITEIETGSPGIEGISFSDIRGDLEVHSPLDKTAPRNQFVERDEILPSEEITQGTQPTKDILIAPESEETIRNPFDEEPLLGDEKPPFGELISPVVVKSENGPAVQNPPAENIISDISDDFHERFEEVVNEDTSESLEKSSLETVQINDGDDLKYPLDQKDEAFTAEEKKLGAALSDVEAKITVKNMFSEKDEIFDFGNVGQKQNISKAPDKAPDKAPNKAPELPLEKIFDKEIFVQKIRPEVISPQAELEKLSATPKKEIKIEPQSEPGLSLKDKIDLTGKLEDKLTLSIKELIWEIVPSLAEKIIKEEIDKIKSEANDTGF